MTSEFRRVCSALDQLRRSAPLDELRSRLEPSAAPVPPRVRPGRHITMRNVEQRWQLLRQHASAGEADRRALLDEVTQQSMGCYEANIENFVGTVKLPVGVAGPLRVNGLHAHGDYYLPLATTEAALVASYHRGAALVTAAGGCTAALLSEGLSRAPGFAFRNIAEAGEFVSWISHQFERLRQVAATTTRHGELVDMYLHVEGNHVYVVFEYSTADASGQNMVTLATGAICDFVVANSPVRPQRTVVESNFTGDKKASAMSFLTVRGRKVTAEVTLDDLLVQRLLHTSAKAMTETWRMQALGGVMSGTMGVQGHYANALAAIYLATGQDVACVSESAVGVTRMELTDQGGLYAAVTLPDLLVGSVGGGTGLPAQQACLRLVGAAGTGCARALAEVCASLCLAGELSIVGALSAGEFTRAHQKLARGRREDAASR